MRIILKILFFPIILIVSIVSAILRLFTIIGGTLLNIVAFLIIGLVLVSLFVGVTTWEEAYKPLIGAFLISEFGLFAIANFLLDKIDILTMKMKAI